MLLAETLHILIPRGVLLRPFWQGMPLDIVLIVLQELLSAAFGNAQQFQLCLE